MPKLSFDTATIKEQDGIVTLRFMRNGSFTVGTQTFGNTNKGWNAALRFCRERNLRVLCCEC